MMGVKNFDTSYCEVSAEQKEAGTGGHRLWKTYDQNRPLLLSEDAS